MATRSIAVLVGSLRKDAHSRKLARALMQLAPPTLDLEIVEIGQMPFYNQDDETDNPPPTFTEFREAIRAADGLLFVTPEYNRSIPAVLKNAIDVGSRPWGKSVWNGTPGAVISQSPGAIGGFGANHHLRQCLAAVNVPCMQHPEAYVGHIADQFEGDELKNESTRAFLQDFMECFATWVERHAD